ncbi:MAG: FAD-dependent oxidoreductase [Cyclobacteriaceae bacterium]
MRIIVIGGLSAGPSAAAKARRINEQAEILLFERTANISYATCGIPYALSGKIKDRDKLMVVKPELLEQRFNIKMHLEEPVIEIDPEKHEIRTSKTSYHYDKLIMATGGASIIPPIELLDQYENWAHVKTIEQLDKVTKSGELERATKVTVIGGGLIGLETAENLAEAGKQVTIIELGNQLLAPWEPHFAHMAEKVYHEKGVAVKKQVSAISINPDTGQITLSNGDKIDSDYLLIGISVKPNTELLVAKGARHISNGALIVNNKMETNLPDVYAAGDCSSVNHYITGEHTWLPMGTHSNKAGRVAGANAAGGSETFEGGYGTAIMKLFDHTIARTGMGPKTLKAKGIDFQSTLIIAGTTPGFYPNPKDIFVEIHHETKSGKLLGAEFFGERGVDKRTDVLSTAIYAGLTIHDLPRLDLAYAPPYAPAKDPVIVAGFVAENSSKGDYKEVGVTEAIKLIQTTEQLQILDVRNSIEIEKTGKIEGSINIPLDEMRDRLEELDTTKPVLVHCAKGLRGYLGALVLKHNGFDDIYNLAGGFTSWGKMQ